MALMLMFISVCRAVCKHFTRLKHAHKKHMNTCLSAHTHLQDAGDADQEAVPGHMQSAEQAVQSSEEPPAGGGP